jgi:ABC-type multidrug transport system fused ATPase/permease subunit
MIYKLLRAPMDLFHDIVPIGQILSRLTKDIESVQLIIRKVTKFIESNIKLIACVIVCYLYNYYSLLLSPILIITNIFITIFYISGARNLERLHRVTFSPILTNLSESIRGIEIIRTTNNEDNFKKKLFRGLDDHYGVHIYTEGCKRWYHQRLRYASHLFNGIMIFIILKYPYLFSAQAIGLILQYGQDFTIELSLILDMYSQIELSMISLERCEAITKIDTEKYIVEDSKRKKNKKINEKGEEMKDIWPSKGEIIFNNFSAQYRPTTPIILKNINFKISAGEKVGIVGRTGSGKSSIILAICRIIEGLEGNILIDNVDITTVNLDTLRHNITVVSQDPFILEGTVKENIDPTGKISDDEIEYIMNEFCIIPEIKDKQKRLNFQIKENGANISIGQKQLICFARAMLKKTKILILDEATSSLDVQTEKIINRNMDKYFKDCTVIMIAHHIQMVKKCKRIFVIDNGEIVEDDTYDNLLKNEKSKFYELYKESLVD